MEIQFPFKGYNTRHALDDQPPLSSFSLLNMRPVDTESGRIRGAGSPAVSFPSRSVTSVDIFGDTYTNEQVGTNAGLTTDPDVLCAYRGRLVASGPSSRDDSGTEELPSALRHRELSGDEDTDANLWNSYQWIMSRQGDPEDFEFYANDAQSPIAGACSPAGKVGDSIKALIPFFDDYLIFGCESSIWVLRGDPGWGGSMDVLIQQEGILGNKAWCFDKVGNLYIATQNGLLQISRGLTEIKNLSRESVPDLFWGIANGDNVQLEFDPRNNGINIATTRSSASAFDSGSNYSYGSQCTYNSGVYTCLAADGVCEGADGNPTVNAEWAYYGSADASDDLFDQVWYDIATGGFFPEQPSGSQDDYHVVIGPLLIAEDDAKRARLDWLDIVTGSSGNVDVKVYAAHSAIELKADVENGTDQSVFTDTAVNTDSGRHTRLYPGVSGTYIGIKLYGSASFQIEKISAGVSPTCQLIATSRGQQIGDPVPGGVSSGKVMFGPLPIVDEGFSIGRLTKLQIEKDTATEVNMNVYVGDTKEDIKDDIAAGTTTYTETLSTTGVNEISFVSDSDVQITGKYIAIEIAEETVNSVRAEIEPAAMCFVKFKHQMTDKNVQPTVGLQKILYGPIDIGGGYGYKGQVAEIEVAQNKDIGSINVKIWAGDTFRECLENYRDGDTDVNFSDTEAALDRSATFYPRTVGGYIMVELTDTEDETPVRPDIESVMIDYMPFGRIKQ